MAVRWNCDSLCCTRHAERSEQPVQLLLPLPIATAAGVLAATAAPILPLR